MKKIILFFMFLFLFAGCSAIEYNVEFNSNGGSIIEEQSIKQGETITKPIAPTKEGFIFQYWESNNKEYNFKNKVSNDIVLNAVWKLEDNVKKYKVTFNDGNSNNSVEVVAGEVVNEPEEPIKSGSNFIGWYIDGDDEPFNFDTIINYDISLVAKFRDGSLLSGGSVNQIIYITELIPSVSKNILTKNETIQIDVEILPNNASNKNLKYTSSNNRVVKISDSGLITALRVGDATITIQTTDDSGISNTIDLTVVDQ